jgi:hypothetical protein
MQDSVLMSEAGIDVDVDLHFVGAQNERHQQIALFPPELLAK